MKKLFAMAAIAVMCLTGCNKANTAEEALDFEKATPEAVVSALAEKVQAGDATAITAALGMQLRSRLSLKRTPRL